MVNDESKNKIKLLLFPLSWPTGFPLPERLALFSNSAAVISLFLLALQLPFTHNDGSCGEA